MEDKLNKVYEHLDEAESVIKDYKQSYENMFKKLLRVILYDLRGKTPEDRRASTWPISKEYIEVVYGEFTDKEWAEIEKQYKHRYEANLFKREPKFWSEL